jgi:hypothetical protein
MVTPFSNLALLSQQRSYSIGKVSKKQKPRYASGDIHACGHDVFMRSTSASKPLRTRYAVSSAKSCNVLHVWPEVTESVPPIPCGEWTAQRMAGNEQGSPAGRSWATAQAVSQRGRPWVWPAPPLERSAAGSHKKRPEGVLYGETPSLHARKRAIPHTAA